MKILTTAQIREADNATIQTEPISSVDLMERAAKACVDWIRSNLPAEASFLVIFGTGNNGGDGLAIARLLFESGRKVNVFIQGKREEGTADHKVNLERLRLMSADIIQESFPVIDRNCVVIDALLGTGLSRPVEGETKDLIKKMNNSGAKILSIDIPSGMYGEDNSANDLDSIVQASTTLTFQCPKLAMLLPGAGDKCGKIVVLDIELNKEFIANAHSPYEFVTADVIKKIYQPRNKFSHKGSSGHALLVCGSEGKMGAAILATRACMHAGAGLTTVRIPANGEAIMQSGVPEAMVSADKGKEFLSTPFLADKQDAMGIGPGIGTYDETAAVIKQLIQDHRMPMVFDADALNILAKNMTWMGFLPKGCILTPHVKEFGRMFGTEQDPLKRLALLQRNAVKYNVCIVLKGAHTSIAGPDGKVYFNSTGNPGLAKGGSGDVLTGIITALLAQGYQSTDAAILGVYLHGLAADIAVTTSSEEALTPGDVIDNLGRAYREIVRP